MYTGCGGVTRGCNAANSSAPAPLSGAPVRRGQVPPVLHWRSCGRTVVGLRNHDNGRVSKRLWSTLSQSMEAIQGDRSCLSQVRRSNRYDHIRPDSGNSLDSDWSGHQRHPRVRSGQRPDDGLLRRQRLPAVWIKGIGQPLTPKSDQYQISPVASPEILHHTVWRTWLFIACSDER